MYLEQELDSLKVVLEIKNNQLHQKEKKVMEMTKLVGFLTYYHFGLHHCGLTRVQCSENNVTF